jgi:hypothetical protein
MNNSVGDALTITSFFLLSASLFSLYFSAPSLISLTFSNPSRRGHRRHLIHSGRPPFDLILSYLSLSQTLAAVASLTSSNPSRRRISIQTLAAATTSSTKTLAAVTSSTQTLAASLTISPSPHRMRSGIASLRDR